MGSRPHAASSFVSFPTEPTFRKNRQTDEDRSFVSNCFLTFILGAEVFAVRATYDPLFIDRARGCQRELVRTPSFVAVVRDDVGAAFSVEKTPNDFRHSG